MINLPVDEAYAFDYLAVLEIKKNNSVQDLNNYNNCSDILRSQIGEGTFLKVIESIYYAKLVIANKLVYDYIEQIRNGEKIDGKVVDDANMSRYFLKRELQKEIFNAALSEKKTGLSY